MTEPERSFEREYRTREVRPERTPRPRPFAPVGGSLDTSPADSISSTESNLGAGYLTKGSPEHQAYQILHAAFVAVPLIAGLDKFTYRLTDWTQYLAPVFPQLFNVSPRSFMHGVGIIEIVAAIGVALKPRFFAYVVAGWLVSICANLALHGGYWDILLRDAGLALGAFALGRLSVRFNPRRTRREREVNALSTASPFVRTYTV